MTAGPIRPVVASALAMMMMTTVMIAVTVSGCVPALKNPPPLHTEAGREKITTEHELSERTRASSLFDLRAVAQAREAAAILRHVADRSAEPREALLDLAQVLVWLADHESDAAVRTTDAKAAVHAGQWCLEVAPENPACHYWLGIAVGVQARERQSTALDALKVMIELLNTARAATPELDHGGPDRVLALVYLRAPGWPGGPGDPDLGYEHAGYAMKIDPSWPPNRLALAEALVAIERQAEGRQEYELALQYAQRAEDHGDPDASEWATEAAAALHKL
jgi:hypothetical protein